MPLGAWIGFNIVEPTQFIADGSKSHFHAATNIKLGRQKYHLSRSTSSKFILIATEQDDRRAGNVVKPLAYMPWTQQSEDRAANPMWRPQRPNSATSIFTPHVCRHHRSPSSLSTLRPRDPRSRRRGNSAWKWSGHAGDWIDGTTHRLTDGLSAAWPLTRQLLTLLRGNRRFIYLRGWLHIRHRSSPASFPVCAFIKST